MIAIILAAGEGTRLRPLTLDRPKCLVELAGKPLLLHQKIALEAAGIVEIAVVTGYQAAQIEAMGFRTFHNSDYAETNMVSSLMCAAELFDGASDILIAYADIVYEPSIIKAIGACSARLSTTIDTGWKRLWDARLDDPLSDAETLRLDSAGDIVELGKKPTSVDEIEGQYMGLVKVRADFAPRLVDFHDQMDTDALYDGRNFRNMYMTSFLQCLIDSGHPLRAVPVKGGWLEVDSTEDLGLYEHWRSSGTLNSYWRPAADGADLS